jgi:hypothetical protein
LFNNIESTLNIIDVKKIQVEINFIKVSGAKKCPARARERTRRRVAASVTGRESKGGRRL